MIRADLNDQPTFTLCVLTDRSSVTTQANTRGLVVFSLPPPLSRVTFQFHISPVAAAANLILPRRSSHSICPEMTPMISHSPPPLILTYLRGLVNPACITKEREAKT